MSNDNPKQDDKQGRPRDDAGWRGDDDAFRVRETRPSDREQEFDENADLPALTRRRNNRFVTGLGFGVIALLGVAMLYAALMRPSGPKNEEPERQASNRLPQLSVPDFIPPPPPDEKAQAPERPASSPEEDILARKMGGSLVLSGASSGGGSGGRPPGANPQAMTEADRVAYLMALQGQGRAPAGGGASGNAGGGGGGGTALGASLRGTDTPAMAAALLGNRDFLLAKGSSLDCALETALNSSVPGMATCRLTRDIYSDNGKVLLLDRGSQLVGEYQGGMRNGQKRMALLWTRAKTPNGVIVRLDSPGTDALGRGGVTGHVDNHFWERFGAAILTSLVSDGIKVIFDNQRSDRGGNSTNIFMESSDAGAKVVEQMLAQSANIPPTLVVNQGTHVSVLVARDLDFSDVYSLKVRQ